MRDRDDDDGRSGPSFREHIRYRFDNLLSRGTSATLVLLGVVTIAAVVLSGLLLSIFGVTFAPGEEARWYEDMWQSLLRVLDTGTMAGDEGWGRRVLALLVTVFGLLVAGTLIGIIAAGVEDRIDSMRRGRSVVIESDHVVVLGASDRLPVLLHQLVLAAAEGGSRTIVVLADLDPAEMHTLARAAGSDHGDTRIVYRFGDPAVPDDLAMVQIAAARAAIVLSHGQSDVAAVQTVLAIAAELGGFDDLTLVVEVIEQETAQRLQRAYGTKVQPLVTSEAIARTTAYALRQRGLSQVLHELIDFQGSDLHLVERPDLTGASFGRLIVAFANARPIGFLREDGGIEIAPSFDASLGAGDRILLIADDTDRLELSGRDGAATPPTDRVATSSSATVDERLVVIGWNDLGHQILEGWATSATSSATVELLVDVEHTDFETLAVPDLGPIPVAVTASDDVIADAIERHPTTVLWLARGGDSDAADVRAILDIEALRRELARDPHPLPRLVIELNQADHASLIELSGPDDLVISDAIGSLFIAQLVDEPLRRDVLLALYGSSHVSMRLVPCEQFDISTARTVADVVDVVTSRGLVLLGWRLHDAERSVILNPHLADLVQLAPEDELIVIG